MKTILGKAFVLRDDIDTDQIIPAQYLNLVPTIPEEYAKLGSYALCGLPDGFPPFIAPGATTSEYVIVIAGRNFGCGSSREHAPIALGAAGIKAIVAESYARIFFRNSVATGELYPFECADRLCEVFTTGDEVEIDIDASRISNRTTGKHYSMKELGAVAPVVEAGGLFAYARKSGIIS
jgi:3-isopropylmalate/(R)-2-methylmalate dehydratase small subunit